MIPQGVWRSLWRLQLRDRTRHTWAVDASDAHLERISSSGEELRLTWSGLPGAETLRVTMVVAAEADAIRWGLQVTGLHPGCGLWMVEYPVLPMPRIPGPGESQWLIPRAGGYVVHSPETTVLRNEDIGCGIHLTHPGNLTMQFIACSREEGPGLWLGTQDVAGFVKQFALQRHQGSDEISVRHLPAGMPFVDDEYVIPYPIAIAAMYGRWWDAAGRYRQWAVDQPWCRHGPLSRRKDLPPWLPQIGLWAWNRGTSEQVIPGALALRQTMDAPIALDWYWWHHTPYDTHYPDYLPPREGAASFRAAVEQIHRAKLRAIVYVNGRLWGTSAPSWAVRRAWEAACRREDGDIYREVYNVFNHAEMAPMCPATPLWQETLTEIVAELVGTYGLDGVYIDQIGIAAPQLCFAEDHGHPTGGGYHWAQGYRTMISRIREALPQDRAPMIPTEGCCDWYLDLFDAFLVLDNSFERMGYYDKIGLAWEPVPLFAAVYHNYAVHFGSYASLAPPPYDERWPGGQAPQRSDRYHESDFSDAFYAELGRAFVAGAQPMVANVDPGQLRDSKLAPHWRFLRHLVHTRLRALPFLMFGRWLPPPLIDVPDIDVDFLVRGVYTPPERERVLTRRLPAVLASRWQADDGRIGIALANISKSPHRVAWTEAGAEPGTSVFRIDGLGRTRLGKVSSARRIDSGVVPARSVAVIEIAQR
ncbi:MAG: hypothetical protein Kow0047_05150 [Anaerolineae bacterium]